MANKDPYLKKALEESKLQKDSSVSNLLSDKYPSKYQFGKEKYCFEDGPIQMRDWDGSWRPMRENEFEKYSRGKGYVTNEDLTKAYNDSIDSEFFNYYIGGKAINGIGKSLWKGGEYLYNIYQNSKFKFDLEKYETFDNANPKQLRKYFKHKGWEIKEASSNSKGFRAKNPNNELDVFHIIEVDKSKLKPGTNIPKIKQGSYLKRPFMKGKGWPDRIPLKDNPIIK